MNRIKIGKHRINLDHITDVQEFGNGEIWAYLDTSSDGSRDFIALKGDAAKLFLMVWDGEDGEEFDALYEKVNGTSAPKEGMLVQVQSFEEALADYQRGFHAGSEAIKSFEEASL